MLLCVAGTALTARAQKVTLNFRNAKLEQVFGRITEQTGYTFYYARPTVNPDKVVSIAVADVDVRAALKQLLADDKDEIELRAGGSQLVQGIESVRAAVAADYFDLHNDRSFIVHY